ncbi:response regulator [Actinomadura nitritigenes]|uniref:Response regulator n=2 Tax=Actinomadura nitritigenes TaxID=134602 RepID=A0ABS3RG60_9ACTN|nr:response regulator [Actinomadura nitritigenes]MBO2445218.1 response regulator [Actinomadura nitritigenes]
MDHPDAPVLAARRRPDATAPQILVVDDQTDWTHVVTAVLREQEWCVRDAIDGADAVTQAERFNPDLVLLDILLPDIDGPEVARRIRARRPDTRVLFLTACDVLDVEIPPGEAYLTKSVSHVDPTAGVRHDLGACRRILRCGWCRTSCGRLLSR